MQAQAQSKFNANSKEWQIGGSLHKINTWINNSNKSLQNYSDSYCIQLSIAFDIHIYTAMVASHK